MSQMKARTYIQITVLSLLCTLMLACSYETKHVQYSLTERPINEDDAALMRGAVAHFSHANGFSSFTEAGMADHLRADGMYVYSFRSADKSYISVINVANVNCYDIGIHSNSNAATARALGEDVRKLLRLTISGDVTAESACNSD